MASEHVTPDAEGEKQRTASQNPSGVPDDVYDRLAARLTAPQIVELARVVGFWKTYNTIHDALRVPTELHLAGDTGYVHA